MADVRVNFDAVPMAPERYDADNERSFRAVVDSMSLDITRALQELKTAAQADAVLLTGDQTVAGVKTFSDRVVLADTSFVGSLSGPGRFRLLALGTGGQDASIEFYTSATNVREWRLLATQTQLRIRRTHGGTESEVVTMDRSTGDVTLGNDLTVNGDILPQGNIDLNVAGRIYARGSTFAPGNGNEFDGVFALGAGARVYLAALQYTADNDQNSLRIYTHPSATGADPSELTAEFRGNPTSGDTGLMLRHKAGGVSQFEVVSVGAIDSGGSGFRVLRIPN